MTRNIFQNFGRDSSGTISLPVIFTYLQPIPENITSISGNGPKSLVSRAALPTGGEGAPQHAGHHRTRFCETVQRKQLGGRAEGAPRGVRTTLSARI